MSAGMAASGPGLVDSGQLAQVLFVAFLVLSAALYGLRLSGRRRKSCSFSFARAKAGPGS